MKQEHYIKISDFFRSFSWGEKLVVQVNNWLTRIIYISFIALFISLGFQKDERFIRVVLVCGISFVIVTIFRMICNTDRPYTIYDFEPLIAKEKKGESMPSRHVFSAFVIAMAFLYTYPWISIPIFAISIVMAIGRVIGGVHFPKDVIVGALIGIISGIIGFYLI